MIALSKARIELKNAEKELIMALIRAIISPNPKMDRLLLRL